MKFFFNLLNESIQSFLNLFTERNSNLPKILILGSSVAKGLNLKKSWAKQLENELEDVANIFNLSKSGFDTDDSFHHLKNIFEKYGKFDIVIISLSLYNEGFKDLINRNYTNLEKENISLQFLDGIEKIHNYVYEKNCIPIICSVYPNSDFDLNLHEESIFVKNKMKNKYQHFIDFYSNVHKNGKWLEDHIIDAGHPNNKGQTLMFQQINLEYIKTLIHSLKKN